MEEWMKTLALDDLPELFQPLADILGVEQAIEFSKQFGGTYLYIPKIDSITRTVRDRKIVKDFTVGLNVRDIAKKYALSDNRVRVIINENYIPGQMTIDDV